MHVVHLELPGLLLLRPRLHGDARGWLVESWSAAAMAEAGLDAVFVQDNHTFNTRGVLRGLHFQRGGTQGKLVRAAVGAIFDVAVDLRPGSPTFGRWAGARLDGEAHEALYVPPGFAHGFQVLSESAHVLYKLTSAYDPATEAGFTWDDPEVGVAWPIAPPLLSARDAAAPSFAAVRPLLS